MMEMNNTCYVYKWTHEPSKKWYVGSRTGKNSNPNDGYVCSSSTVRKLIATNPSDWTRTIIAIGNADEMYDLETEILQTFDARSDERSFNRHNNHKGIAIGGWNKGMTGLQTAWNKGITGEQSHMNGNINAIGHTPWNKGKTITDPVLKEKYRQSAIRRHKNQKIANNYIQGE
jgi:hypothetical protein